nr:hypothetical protein [Tanacetum cinerariifolium]
PSVMYVETSIPTTNPKTAIPKPTSNGNRRNRKSCFVCKSLDHLIKDCDYHEKKLTQTTARNHAPRGHYKHYASIPLPNPQRYVVPTAIVPKSKLVPINAARLITAVVPKINVTRTRQDKPIVTKPNSPPRRHINHSPSPKVNNFPLKVTVVQVPHVTAAKGAQKNGNGNQMSYFRPCFPQYKCINKPKKGNPQHALKDKGVINSGCLRYMTWNMSYLYDFEELNGGYVAFGGNPKGGKIFGKEKAREENVQQYVFFPVWYSGSTNPQNTNGDASFDKKEPEFEGRKPESEVNVSPSSNFEDFFDNNINEDDAAGTLVLTVGQLSPNSTNTFSAAGPSNADDIPTHRKSTYMDSSQLPDDPNMPELEDITYSDDEDDVGVEAGFNNLETSITVSPILTTRVHKDHPVTQIIGDLSSATQIRSMTRVAKDQGGLSQINNDDFYTYRKSASTPIDTKKPLLKDPDGEDVDVHTYRSMIGSLMYLTSSRLDIMFTVCACACFQITPKASHLHAVKRIFRYLKGKLHLGLWYPKDSPFNFMAYSDSDYAGASPDRKYTTEGYRFLGCRLISSQCKKQTVVATSSTEVEYVAAGSCVKTPRYDEDMLELMELTVFLLPSDEKKVNDITRLQALVDKKRVIITEATIIDALRLDDAEGVECLPNEEIFTENDSRTTSCEGAAEVNVENVSTAGVAAEGASSVADDKVPAAGRIIADMDADKDVTLKDVAVVAKDVQDAEIEESLNDVDIKPDELQEVVEVVTTAKLITEVVTVASATITDAAL